MQWIPENYQKAAIIADEARAEMLMRLNWVVCQPHLVLDLGAGCSNSAVALQQHYPEASVIAIDHAFNMLAANPSNTKINADATALPLRDTSVDLIFANLLLPWQNDLLVLLKECLRVLKPGGLLSLSALGIDTLREWRSVFHKESLPQFYDMHDIGDALLQLGFSDPVLDVNHYTLVYQAQNKLLDELQASGMVNITKDRAPFYLEQMQAVPMNEESVWPVTYEVIHAHAFAPTQKETQDGTVRVPLSALRKTLK